MNEVCIGVPVRERRELLAATLESLQAFTPEARVVLLGDGPDAATDSALQAARCDQLLSWKQPRGVAHCFNRLVTECTADFYVLLENGAQVSPGWLPRLMTALSAHETHGLAGPSTNRAWNEQAAFHDCGPSEAELLRVAAEAAARFGDSHATLEPLHSLGDFCYLVGRNVIERIGAADEGYGQGPCWEMDYNVRAARAGFRGVWAKAAFVRRAPQSKSQAALEARRFPASKRRYQDHYCGLRLRQQTAHYDAHCVGDACAHFAPAELIRARRVFPTASVASAAEARERARLDPVAPEPRAAVRTSAAPLVSCVMPTRARREFLAMAFALFRRQSYPHRELIVIDDARESARDLIPQDEQIRYVHLDREMTLGDKRNLGCELAHGTFVMHWDDDDWYGVERIAAQVAPLVRDTADVTALTMPLVLELSALRFWRCRGSHHARIHFRDLCPGTLAFRRALWLHGARYAPVRCAEDVAFIKSLPASTRILRLTEEQHFVCVRHGSNTWSLKLDWRGSPAGWQPSGPPEFMPSEDLDTYAAIRRGLHPVTE
jgi:glycosyltransferase involved in cell wall biosynthesis